jgi:hypothetical protein
MEAGIVGLRIKRTALAVLAVCALAGGAVTAQEAQPQSIVVTGQRGTSPWIRAESAHVVVVSNAARADVARLVEHLERLDALLRMVTTDYGVAATGPEPKLNLMYLEDSHDLDRVTPDRPNGGVGLFRDCADGAQGFLLHTGALPEVADDRLATAPLHEGLSYVSQAYARHFLYRHTDVRVPSLWIEGFASYFSGVMFGTKQMVIGRLPPGVRSYLDYKDKGRQYRLEYAGMLGPDPYKNLYDTHAKTARVEYQARAWILAHYILGADERRQHLGAFLKAVGEGTDPAAALRDAFGLDVGGDASQVLWRYQKQGANVLRVDMPWQARPEVAVTTMSATSGEFVLADAVLKSCPARAQGEALLRTLATDAAKVSNVDAGQLALSRARVDWGDPAAALPWLRKAASAADAGADVLVLLARADLKLAARADADVRTPYLDEAYAVLGRARVREPKSGAVALAGLDYALLTDETPARGSLDRVIAAWQTTRDSGPLARAAVLAWSYLADTPKAAHVLRMLANDSRDPAMAAWAVQFQRRFDAGLTRAAIVEEMRKGLNGGAPAGGGNEWTFDLVGLVKEVDVEDAEVAARKNMDLQQQKFISKEAARSISDRKQKPQAMEDTRLY